MWEISSLARGRSARKERIIVAKPRTSGHGAGECHSQNSRFSAFGKLREQDDVAQLGQGEAGLLKNDAAGPGEQVTKPW